MDRKVIRTVSTRMFEGDDAVNTELTIDFTGLSDADILEVAAQAAVVKWQGNARRSKSIPATATYTVPRPGTRGAVALTPANLVARYGSIDKAIEALQAMQDAKDESAENVEG